MLVPCVLVYVCISLCDNCHDGRVEGAAREGHTGLSMSSPLYAAGLNDTLGDHASCPACHVSEARSLPSVPRPAGVSASSRDVLSYMNNMIRSTEWFRPCRRSVPKTQPTTSNTTEELRHCLSECTCWAKEVTVLFV